MALNGLLLAAVAAPTVHASPHTKPRTAAAVAVLIPAGSYRSPFDGAAHTVAVASFRLDRTPVTRVDFARFVRAHPQWAAERVAPAQAERGYLRPWPAETASTERDAETPVTRVSWHAAAAYCAAQGKRLPTTAEWELAAAASEHNRDASADAQFRRRVLALYSSRRAGPPARIRTTFRNAYGLDDMHGLVWELTADVGTAERMDHSAHMAMGPKHDHTNCAGAAIGVADPSDYAAFLRYAVRARLTSRTVQDGVGFRCAS